MKFQVLLKPVPGKGPADFQRFIVEEEIALWSLYTRETVREMYFDPTDLTVSLVFEAASRQDVETLLQALPMVQAGLFVADIFHLGSWRPLEALFRPGVLDGPSPASVIRGIYDAVAASDWNAVLARLDENIILEQSPALPFAGVWRGHEGFQRMGEAIFRAWPDFTVEPFSFAEAGDTVLVLTRVRGSGANPSVPLDQPMIEFWRVRDGKAVECRPHYFDPVTAARGAAADAYARPTE